MATIQLPVRWYSGYGPDNPDGNRFDDLDLPLETTAFMIVDSDCGKGNPCVEEGIAPALKSARAVGMHVFFIHNDFSLCDEPGSIKREIHGTRWGNKDAADRPAPERRPLLAELLAVDSAPRPRARLSQAGVVGVSRDPHRLSPALPRHQDPDRRGILAAVLPLLHLCRRGGTQLPGGDVAGLHPCRLSTPIQMDDSLPEGGWLRKIMLRNFEHVVGYTSTSAEFVQACSALTEAQP